ncbi:hypothetical protein D3C75_1117100 [compost metagenome]
MAVGQGCIFDRPVWVRIDNTNSFSRQVNSSFFIEAEIIDILQQPFRTKHLKSELNEGYVTGALHAIKETNPPPAYSVDIMERPTVPLDVDLTGLKFFLRIEQLLLHGSSQCNNLKC